MAEPRRHPAPSPWPGTPDRPTPARIAVVGAGRLGSALAAALRASGRAVEGPLGRGQTPGAETVILCVPDAEITAAAEAVAGMAPLVGHTSGATPLDALAPAARAGAAVFGLHPLQTFTGAEPVDGGAARGRFAGAGCAVTGSTPGALAAAVELARAVGMRPFELADGQRAAYHAAASIASNFLVTLEAAAERMAAGASLDPGAARRLLAPLVRATVENWSELGPERALTGPIARGDEASVAAQREAVAEHDPGLLPLFDALAERTRALARDAQALEGPSGPPSRRPEAAAA